MKQKIQFKEGDLQKIAERFFTAYPNVELFYATSDMNAFWNENFAKNHSNSAGVAVEKIIREKWITNAYVTPVEPE